MSPFTHGHSALSQDCLWLEDPESTTVVWICFHHSFLFPFPCCSEVKGILVKLQEAEQWMEKSVLIGCSDEHRPCFALDLGWDVSSSTHASSTWMHWDGASARAASFILWRTCPAKEGWVESL